MLVFYKGPVLYISGSNRRLLLAQPEVEVEAALVRVELDNTKSHFNRREHSNPNPLDRKRTSMPSPKRGQPQVVDLNFLAGWCLRVTGRCAQNVSAQLLTLSEVL